MLEGKVTIQGMYLLNEKLFSGISCDFVDKDDLIRYIMYKAMDRPLIYDNPYYLEDCITLWWKTHKDNFKKIWDVINEKYDPLHNYDGTETTTFSNDTTGGFNNSNAVSAFDSDKLKTDSENSGDTIGHAEGTTTVIKGGNLGVTMTQDMLKSEVNLRIKTNFFDVVSVSFNSDFTYYFFE